MIRKRNGTSLFQMREMPFSVSCILYRALFAVVFIFILDFRRIDSAVYRDADRKCDQARCSYHEQVHRCQDHASQTVKEESLSESVQIAAEKEHLSYVHRGSHKSCRHGRESQ